MSFENVVKSMSGRMPWPVGQRLLRELGLPRGQGWERTVARLTNPDADFSEHEEALEAALREHNRCGEKLVRLYQVDEDANATLRKALLAVEVPASEFASQYPLSIDGDALDAKDSLPQLISVESVGEGVVAVFGSVRSVALREVLTSDELPAGTPAALSAYEEIIGIRHIRHEAIDIVAVSPGSPFEDVRVDYPPGMPRDTGELVHAHLREALEEIVGGDALTLPVNLYPLINKMYRAPHEGIVVELAFGTTTASLKHEKMRRRGSCLRQEAYHMGGKAALKTPIEPHKVSIVWQRPIQEGFSRPELGLYARALTAGSAKPVLHDAVIQKCIGEDDYDYVMSRISHYLKPRAQAAV